MNTNMKWSAALCLAALAPLAAGAAETGFDLKRWSHVAPVELAAPPGKGLVEVPLPLELMAAARADLADLRVADADGKVVPHVLRTDRGQPGLSVAYRSPRLFNQVYTPGRQSQVCVDFGPPNATSAQAISNARTVIFVETPGTNFRRRVMVEAGTDGTTWQTLRASDWLFRVSAEPGTYEKSEVRLPENDFRYLRVTVYNASDDPAELPIRSVSAQYFKRVEAETLDVAVKSMEITQIEKEHVTQIEVDLGYENVPLYNVTVVAEGGYFLRRVDVQGRDAKTRLIEEPMENGQPRTREVEVPFSRLGDAAIYVLPGGREGQDTSTSLTLPLNGQSRYLRLRIFNGDDAPLKVSALKVQRLQCFAGFAAATGSYRLFAGNPDAIAPQYDLETYAPRLREAGLTKASLGPVAPNAQFAAQVKTVPWSEQHAVMLWVSLGAVMAVLAAVVLRQARHIKPASSQG